MTRSHVAQNAREREVSHSFRLLVADVRTITASKLTLTAASTVTLADDRLPEQMYCHCAGAAVTRPNNQRRRYTKLLVRPRRL